MGSKRRSTRPRTAAEVDQTAAAATSDAVRSWRGDALALAGILLATLAAYAPAWHGGMVWDDESHLTAVGLRSLDGLRRIWLEVGATAQYYPLLHSAFWLQHRLWGDDTLGYHLVNIVLHVGCAALFLVILRRLRVPGAPLAAAVFALHPVHVESVAWMTELKNTLSGLFFLAAGLVYLRFDERRSRRAYVAAGALFVLALLSKSVTATLPGVLLIVLWWQRGRLGWRRDVRPLLPFFAIGAAAGLFTAWVEKTHGGAHGSEFQLTLLERALSAGRVVWFYLGKLAWPADLVFTYPRWHVSASDPWGYAYPLALAVLLVAAWASRGRTRAPLASLLAFGGMLFPVLGFLDVYPFRFSFVADHFQYLASLSAIALISAAVSGAWSGLRLGRPEAVVASASLALALGALTWQQSRQYADGPTLYRATIERNPSSWMAHGNLGALLRRSDPAQAVVHLTEALRLKPDLVEARYNLAALLQETGKLAGAAAAYREVLALAPENPRAYANLGNTLRLLGRAAEAESAYAEAIRIAPRLAIAHTGLGRVLQDQGRLDEALQACDEAVRLEPGLASAHHDRAGVLRLQGRHEDAIAAYETALRLEPRALPVLLELAATLQEVGRFEDAAGRYAQAAVLDASSGLPHAGLATALRMAGQIEAAEAAGRRATTLQPRLAFGHYALANALQARGRDAEALAEYRAATRLQPDEPELQCALALALERGGDRAGAGARLDEALRLAPDESTARAAMASALEAQGRFDEARAELTELLRIAPGLAAARVALARLERSRGVATAAGRGAAR